MDIHPKRVGRTFPIARKPLSSQTAKARKAWPSKRSRSSVRVVVVDDHPSLANALVDILAANFYDAWAAYSATEALNLAQAFRPDAVIADVILPGTDGFELATELRKRYPETRILLMSAGFCGVQTNGRGFRVVSKSAATAEIFQLLEDFGNSSMSQATDCLTASSL